MKKIIICTSVVVCMSMGDVFGVSTSVYGCKSGSCFTGESVSGSSCICDGYAMSAYPTYTCQSALDCAYNEDDVDNCGVVCYKGWCARTISTRCDDYQYEGNGFAPEGLFDNVCYDCPANATCDGHSMYCNAGYYMVHLGRNQQVIVNGDALVMGCQKCPAGTSGQQVTSQPGATGIFECYTTGGTDNTGTYIYTSNCYYED